MKIVQLTVKELIETLSKLDKDKPIEFLMATKGEPYTIYLRQVMPISTGSVANAAVSLLFVA